MNIIKRSKKWINKPDIHDSRVKFRLLNYLMENVPYWQDMGIQNIDVRTKGKDVDVTITLSRPGLLIGRRGSTIDAIESNLSETINSMHGLEPFDIEGYHGQNIQNVFDILDYYSVKVHIVEHDPFRPGDSYEN